MATLWHPLPPGSRLGLGLLSFAWRSRGEPEAPACQRALQGSGSLQSLVHVSAQAPSRRQKGQKHRLSLHPRP